MAAKAAREMRDVLEADLIGDFGNGAVALGVGHEHLVGALQPLGLDELAHRGLVVVEQAIEVAQGDSAAGCDLLRRQRLVPEMALDEVDDPAA